MCLPSSTLSAPTPPSSIQPPRRGRPCACPRPPLARHLLFLHKPPRRGRPCACPRPPLARHLLFLPKPPRRGRPCACPRPPLARHLLFLPKPPRRGRPCACPRPPLARHLLLPPYNHPVGAGLVPAPVHPLHHHPPPPPLGFSRSNSQFFTLLAMYSLIAPSSDSFLTTRS